MSALLQMAARASVAPRPVPVVATDPNVPAVASLALRELLTGPPRPVRELARFSQALYLVVDDGPIAASSAESVGIERSPSTPTVTRAVHDPPAIALLTPGAVAVPGALQLTAGLDRWPAAPAVGTAGGGRLTIAGRVVVVHRWWDPVPRLRSTTVDRLHDQAVHVAGRLHATPAGVADSGSSRCFAHLLAALSSGDERAAASAADAMLGLGPGLTPSGDDLLAGLLASLPPLQASIAATRVVADPVSASRRLAATIADRAEGRTTTVSAELLRHAARGAVAHPVLQLLRALTGHGAIDAAVADLLAVGSSSGRELTTGILAAVALLTGDRTLHPITRSLPRGR